MATFTEARAVVTNIIIATSPPGTPDDPTTPGGNRLILAVETQTDTGQVIRQLSKDVTADLTATQQQIVDNIVARAQQWADAQL